MAALILGMIVAVQIGPDGGVGVEIFPAVHIAQHRAFACNDDNRLALQPVAHLRERMPDDVRDPVGRADASYIFDLRFAIYDLFQRADKCRDIVSRMRGGEGDAQPGLAARDGRITDGGNENVLFAQFGCGGNRLGFVADDDGNDGAAECGVRNAECGMEFRQQVRRAVSGALRPRAD